MPAVSERQRRFMGADLARARAGERTRTGMSARQLAHFAAKPVRGRGGRGGGESEYVWPILGGTAGAGITTPFGAGQVRAAGFTGRLPWRNNGLDIGAAAGTPVVSPATGRVVGVLEAQTDNSGYGNSVLIEDGAGNRHRLSHLMDAPAVQVGEAVQAGQRVGRVGQTGNATGPHLDYEYILQGGGFADPLSLDFGGAGVADGATSGRQQPTVRELTLAAFDQLDAHIERLEQVARDPAADEYERAKAVEALTTLYGRRSELLGRLIQAEAEERRGLGPQRTPAQEEADRAQADLFRAQAGNVGASTAAQRYAAELGAGSSRYAADVGAQSARYATDQREREAQLQALTQLAQVEVSREHNAIVQAFNEGRLSLDQARARSDEAYQRAQARLEAERNALLGQQQELTARGQDLSAQVDQRGQDLRAATDVRGQDLGRLNQQLASGASLYGQTLGTSGQLGVEASRAAVASLPFAAPPGTNAYLDALLAGRPAAPPAPMAFPFDPTQVGAQIAAQALERFSPAARALLAAGSAPAPAFVAPQAVALPPVPPLRPPALDLPPPFFPAAAGGYGMRPRPMGGGYGFRAPVTLPVGLS